MICEFPNSVGKQCARLRNGATLRPSFVFCFRFGRPAAVITRRSLIRCHFGSWAWIGYGSYAATLVRCRGEGLLSLVGLFLYSKQFNAAARQCGCHYCDRLCPTRGHAGVLSRLPTAFRVAAGVAAGTSADQSLDRLCRDLERPFSHEAASPLVVQRYSAKFFKNSSKSGNTRVASTGSRIPGSRADP